MYKLNEKDDQLTQIEEKSLSQIGKKEKDLQKWIMKNPKCLGGEPLLIIAEEYAGFNATNERLDLLALDEKGRLVVIENKRDNSGKNVIWQALRYVSYVSQADKNQIVQIYQEYLDKHQGGSAKERLSDFLSLDSEEAFETLKLNTGYGQRMILTASDFPIEVTSAVMWLRQHDIEIQCFKVTSYECEDATLIDIDQIIPPPEIKEFIVGIATKEREEALTSTISQNRNETLNLEFWSYLLRIFKKHNTPGFMHINPSKNCWISTTFGIGKCSYQIRRLADSVRIELLFDRDDKRENKKMFDCLQENKGVISENIGLDIVWNRLDDGKSSRIFISHLCDTRNKHDWKAISQWLLEHYSQFTKTFEPYLAQFRENSKG